jgi:hypothetical protein
VPITTAAVENKMMSAALLLEIFLAFTVVPAAAAAVPVLAL